jgi:hypothetical protein
LSNTLLTYHDHHGAERVFEINDSLLPLGCETNIVFVFVFVFVFVVAFDTSIDNHVIRTMSNLEPFTISFAVPAFVSGLPSSDFPNRASLRRAFAFPFAETFAFAKAFSFAEVAFAGAWPYNCRTVVHTHCGSTL